jgi:hypothetical protein
MVMFFGLAPSLSAQDDVTVPKSRLEELERKEKELEQLKANQSKTNLNVQPVAPKAAPTAPAATVPQPSPLAAPAAASAPVQSPPVQSPPVQSPPIEPVVTYTSPALDSLPPFKPYDVVESMDLANYYHADVHSADARFRKQKLSVRGEIVGFEKPLWNRTYRILLKTPAREAKVICDLLPPPKSNAVFTTNHGGELVALMGETRVPIAKVGQTVIVKGECKGAKDKDSEIYISGWDLKAAP